MVSCERKTVGRSFGGGDANGRRVETVAPSRPFILCALGGTGALAGRLERPREEFLRDKAYRR